MYKTFLATILTVLAFIPAVTARADISGSYNVREVVTPDKVGIIFHGLPIMVRLAHVKARPEAQAVLKELVEGEEVSIRYADELGFDEAGVPYVNMAVGPALKRKIVNVELVAAGVADYDTSRASSKAYDGEFVAARDQAQKAQLGLWAGTDIKAAEAAEPVVTAAAPAVPVAARGVLAEINATFYHLPTCQFSQGLSKRNIVRYADPEAAERAGKCPCARCQKERARLAREKQHGASAGRAAWPGKLIGLKSDPTWFYSPVAPRLKGVAPDDMIGFETLEEAKASGRKPDTNSLRLTAPPGYLAEPPEPGECIGRALPFFRPCRRPAADASGLCLECQRGE